MSQTTARTAQDAEAGFTLLEISISMVLLVTILYVINTTLFTGNKASSSTSVLMDFSDKLRITASRISDDVRAASRDAEDTDHDGALTQGEDTNNNGRLDSDWSVTGNSIRFNRLMADGTYSLPITYRLNGTHLERVTMTKPDGTEVVTTLTTDVTNFTVSEMLPRVTFQMTISKRLDGRLVSRSNSFTVTPRN
jgi:type II secretory pathway component PulJ